MSFDKSLMRAVRNRARRLLRLMKLGAPSPVVFNECRLIYDTAKALGEGRWAHEFAKLRAKDEAKEVKNIHGYCHSDGCQRRCHPEFSFEGSLYCQAHHEEVLANERAMQEDMEVWRREAREMGFDMDSDDEDEDENS